MQTQCCVSGSGWAGPLHYLICTETKQALCWKTWAYIRIGDIVPLTQGDKTTHSEQKRTHTQPFTGSTASRTDPMQAKIYVYAHNYIPSIVLWHHELRSISQHWRGYPGIQHMYIHTPTYHTAKGKGGIGSTVHRYKVSLCYRHEDSSVSQYVCPCAC